MVPSRICTQQRRRPPWGARPARVCATLTGPRIGSKSPRTARVATRSKSHELQQGTHPRPQNGRKKCKSLFAQSDTHSRSLGRGRRRRGRTQILSLSRHDLQSCNRVSLLQHHILPPSRDPPSPATLLHLCVVRVCRVGCTARQQPCSWLDVAFFQSTAGSASLLLGRANAIAALGALQLALHMHAEEPLAQCCAASREKHGRGQGKRMQAGTRQHFVSKQQRAKTGTGQHGPGSPSAAAAWWRGRPAPARPARRQ